MVTVLLRLHMRHKQSFHGELLVQRYLMTRQAGRRLAQDALLSSRSHKCMGNISIKHLLVLGYHRPWGAMPVVGTPKARRLMLLLLQP